MHRNTLHAAARPAGAALLFSLVVAAAVAAFTWPAARLEPRGLPLGVAGPPPVAAALERRLDGPAGAFEIVRYADEAAARAAIEDRDVYGALVAFSGRTTLLTASAASPLVAQLLEDAFASSGGVRVRDVVPADSDDPRGTVFAGVLLPLTLVGVIAGVLVAALIPAGRGGALAVTVAALAAGLAAVGVVQGWLGAVPGDWWLNAAALGLLVLAIGSLAAGMLALLGPPALALTAAVLLLLGNPWSGASSAPDLLPEWAGVTGQLLPPGAGATLLRSTAFFDGSGGEGPAAVLLVWTALGIAAAAAATLRGPVRRVVLAGRL